MDLDVLALLEQLPAIVWATDRDLRILYCRGAALKHLGLTSDELVDSTVPESVGAADGPPLVAHQAALDGTSTTYQYETNGRVFHVHVEPLWRGPRIDGTIGVALDVTDRVRIEATLRQRERELIDFFENAPVAMHWVGPDGTILRANHAQLEMLGYAAEEYIGRAVVDFHVDRAPVDDILARLARAETLHAVPARLRARDGSVRHVLLSCNARMDDGRLVHTRWLTRDVTDAARAEQAQRQADVLEQVRRLAHAAAHEINNPLAVMSVQIDLLSRHAAPEDQARIESCRQAIYRVSAIVDRMNRLTRLESATGWPADLPAMLDLWRCADPDR